MQINIDADADALAMLLGQARVQLSRRAEPAARGRHRAELGGASARLGENGRSGTFRTNLPLVRATQAARVWHALRWFRESGFDDTAIKLPRCGHGFTMMSTEPLSADAAGSTATGLDAEALGRLRELDPKGENKLLERVLRTFQTSAARLMPQLETARLANDRATVRLVAHTLKSSSASIGALELSHVCSQVEALIRAESADDLDPLLHRLRQALAAALNAIQRLLDSRP